MVVCVVIIVVQYIVRHHHYHVQVLRYFAVGLALLAILRTDLHVQSLLDCFELILYHKKVRIHILQIVPLLFHVRLFHFHGIFLSQDTCVFFFLSAALSS